MSDVVDWKAKTCNESKAKTPKIVRISKKMINEFFPGISNQQMRQIVYGIVGAYRWNTGGTASDQGIESRDVG